MISHHERPAPPTASMSEGQKGNYLSSLRSNLKPRPSGSRPAPPSRFTGSRQEPPKPHNVIDDRPILQSSNSAPVMTPTQITHTRTDSTSSGRAHPFAGRPLARAPSSDQQATRPRQTSRKVSIPYMEREERAVEKQEARSLRMAMEGLNVDEETRVYSAAQDEAAELVWKHQNKGKAEEMKNAPFANPDNPNARVDVPTYLRKSSHASMRSQNSVPVAKSRNVSGDSRRSMGMTEPKSLQGLVTKPRKVSPPQDHVQVRKNRSPSGQSYGGLAEAVATDIARAQRRSSSGSKRIMSGEKKPFMNPNDKIWEDPQEEPTPPKKLTPVAEMRPVANPIQPIHLRKNPFARARAQHDDGRSESAPVLPTAKRHAIEIHRNPPSQSRKPLYTANESLPPTPPSAQQDFTDDLSPRGTPTKDGREVRGDDIRAATGKSRRDRSPNLPSPTMVSDKPGRPIVSFQQRKELMLEGVFSTPPPRTPDFSAPEPSKKSRSPSPSPSFNPEPMKMPPPPPPSVGSHAKPPIPVLNLPDDEDDFPSVVLPEEPDFPVPAPDMRIAAPMIPPPLNISPPSMRISAHIQPDLRNGPPTSYGPPPVINIHREDMIPPLRPRQASPQRPLPTPSRRPLPHHSSTAPVMKSTPHYTPSVRGSSAQCAQCALPIAGRILSAAGERFHPSCFTCHECHTNLELVAFYPEPDRKRDERLERIHARQQGYDIELPEGMTEEEYMRQEAADGDPTLRFYCHLDFHEIFSPRCKSCKTPIEGEVVVACGAEWHAGHFFCAQCGDPFDSTTPFVERDGHAWCVGCHTNRYSSKCRKCKKPVTDLVVKALGWEWHENCFSCVECNGDFDDGRYFLRGEAQDPVCVKCEERRLKA